MNREDPFASRLTLAPLGALIVCWSAMAEGHITDEEIFARLSWVALLPVGVGQMLVAAIVKRHLLVPLVGRVALASFVSLVVAFFAVLLIDDRRAIPSLVRVLSIFPGLPTVIALARAKVWLLAVALLILPPLVCMM